jgi:hypothetical protein
MASIYHRNLANDQYECCGSDADSRKTVIGQNKNPRLSLMQVRLFVLRNLIDQAQDVYLLPVHGEAPTLSIFATSGSAYLGRYNKNVPLYDLLKDATDAMK